VTSLNTYGAVLTFAIQLEGDLRTFYKAAAELGGEHAEQFEEYAQKSAKRQQRLVAIRQDNVTEIVLEPITGLDGQHYVIDPSAPANTADSLVKARANEQHAERFYREAGPKLNVTEPRRAFQKLAQENGDRLTDLGNS